MMGEVARSIHWQRGRYARAVRAASSAHRRQGRHVVDSGGAVIVLLNPWSTPSPKKPLPMSLLAVGALLEGEFEYEIVDGNVEADPVGAHRRDRRPAAAHSHRHHGDARAAVAHAVRAAAN